MKPSRLLLVEDEAPQRAALHRLLEDSGYQVQATASGEEALLVLGQSEFPLMLTDLSMPGISGIELTHKARAMDPELAVIVMTAHGSLDTAIGAIRAGAADYLLKPLEYEEVLLRLRQVLRARELSRRVDRLEKENRQLRGDAPLSARSPGMRKVLADVEQVAPTDATVLLGGETGVGKEVVARYVHERSTRRAGSFVAVNCSAIPDNLLESEFFGHEKGAFTGADRRAEGLFERAEGGTLFLDEIGDMDLKLQAKVLRALEERRIRRVGGVADVAVNFRLVAATHRSLQERVAEGRFREDLFFRLNVVAVTIPPLRQRPEDLPGLIQVLLERHAKSLGKVCPGVDPAVVQALQGHSFPGNVRELSNILERALIFMEGPVLQVADIPDLGSGQARAARHATHAASAVSLVPTNGTSLGEIMADFEKRVLTEKQAACSSDMERMAKELQVSRSTLYSKMAKYGIK